jgi:UDP-GlcNAc:undecaprenyl-phosphate GlcNAc-1-phosphate transferase
MMGIFDDVYNTRPLIKLSIQICCGLIFYYTGSMIEITAYPLLNITITTLWVVLLMNSLNLLDNMDGITGITTIFILIACFSLNLLLGIDSNQLWNLMLLSVIGSLIGFLVFNVPPAKLFMGDSGSQYLGLIVAFFSIKFIFGAGSIANAIPLWQVILGLIVCCSAPLIDTFTVFFNRLKRKSSPFIGGKDHTTHHLVYKGYSEKKVFYCFTLIGLISALFTFLLFWQARSTMNWFSFLALAWFLFAFYFLYKNTLIKSQKK